MLSVPMRRASGSSGRGRPACRTNYLSWSSRTPRRGGRGCESTTQTRGAVRLVLANKATTEPTSLTYAQALEEALCHGWIDGQTLPRDGRTHMQRFTPRTRRSNWSKRNVGIVERLVVEGRMQPSGLAAVDSAKADGRWESAYAGSAEIEIPPELAEALATNPRVAEMWEILTSQNRYAVLYRVSAAKKPETRARRIAKFLAMLERGETIYPQKRGLNSRAQR